MTIYFMLTRLFSNLMTDTDVQVHPNYEGDTNRNFTSSSDFVQVPIGSLYENIGTSTAFFSPSAGERLPFDAMALVC